MKLSQCAGKVPYYSENRALLSAQRQADSCRATLFVYRCNLCPHWHMTRKVFAPDSGFPRPTATAFPRGPEPVLGKMPGYSVPRPPGVA
jgi:hypothetical protein